MVPTALGALGEMSPLLPAAPSSLREIAVAQKCHQPSVGTAEMVSAAREPLSSTSAGWPRLSEAGAGEGLCSAPGVGFLQGNLHK